MKNVVCAVIAGIILLAGVSVSPALPPPTNYRIALDHPELQNEEMIWVCPTDSNIVIADWRDFRLGYRQVGVGRSTDGGDTWVDSLANRVKYDQQSDPCLDVDRDGNFYLCFMDWGVFVDQNSALCVTKSTDKGLTWSLPVGFEAPPGMYFEDKQFITIDRTGGFYDGNFYMSWARYPFDTYEPNRIAFVRSTDGVSSFGDSIIVGPLQDFTSCGYGVIEAGQFAQPIVGSDGSVYVFWTGFDTVACELIHIIKMAKSTNGGASFSDAEWVQFTYGDWETYGYHYWDLIDGDIDVYNAPAAAADITGGPFDGNIYISYASMDTSNTEYKDYNIEFIRSDDGGQTWTEKVYVNDDLTGSSAIHDQFHPWLFCNEEGTLVSIFYDQRLDPNHYEFDLFAAYSFDAGRTFTTNHRISEVSSSPDSLGSRSDGESPGAVRAGGPRAGRIAEYIGVTAFKDHVNAIWTDTRDGNQNVYGANWVIPILEPRLSAPPDGAYLPSNTRFEWSTCWKHDQDRYRLEYSTDPTFLTDVNYRYTDTNFIIEDTLLREGLHYWRVKASNLTGTDSSEFSPVWTFTVDTTTPVAPTLLLPEDGEEVNDPTPLFDWTTSDKQGSPVTYDLYIATDSTFPVGPDTRIYTGLPESEYTPDDSLADSSVNYWKVVATDGVGLSSTSTIFSVMYIPYVCGDVDGSGAVDVGDLTYLVAYLFQSGPPPPVIDAADVDGSDFIDVADLTYLVGYLFQGGPAPVC
ncbi:MAG: dockerin type I domain-containing protein [bacterium]